MADERIAEALAATEHIEGLRNIKMPASIGNPVVDDAAVKGYEQVTNSPVYRAAHDRYADSVHRDVLVHSGPSL